MLTKTDSPPEWMTIEEVTDYLKFSRAKLYAMAQGGEILCSKVAGQWRFFRPEIDEGMLKQRPSGLGGTREDSRGEWDASGP